MVGSDSVQVFIPFILSLYDSFRYQRLRSDRSGQPLGHDVRRTTHFATQRRYLASSFRFIPPAFFVSYGSHLTSDLWSGTSSTYICPLVAGQIWTVPAMQFIATALDCCLAVIAYELCLCRPTRDERVSATVPLAWGFILSVRAIHL